MNGHIKSVQSDMISIRLTAGVYLASITAFECTQIETLRPSNEKIIVGLAV